MKTIWRIMVTLSWIWLAFVTLLIAASWLVNTIRSVESGNVEPSEFDGIGDASYSWDPQSWPILASVLLAFVIVTYEHVRTHPQ
jgi:hypothetical protein